MVYRRLKKVHKLSGKNSAVDIQYLGDHKELIPVLAGWIYDEWSFLYSRKTARYIESLLRKRVNKKNLPLTLVALKAGVPVGTISLKPFDMDTRRNLTPWLTSLYIAEPWRRRGIGSSLVKAAEQKAAELKIHKLFLFTTGALVPFYKKLGWNVKEKTTYRRYPVIIMERDFSA